MCLAFVLAVTSVLTYSPAQAQNTAKNTGLVAVKELESWYLNIDQWVSSSGKLASAKKEILKYSDKLALDEQQRYIVKTKEENAYLVYYPIKGAEKDSKYYMIFNNKGEFLEDILMLGLKNEDSTIHSVAQKNNQVIFDAQIREDGMIESGYAILPNNVKKEFSKSTVTPEGWWSCFNNCLAAQGVAAWAVAIVGTMCGIACAATFGIGCAICFGGISVVSGSVVGYCSGTCQKDPGAY
ncbi:hypothetical protein [Paenibacillus elgii]|uniref:hypothetical protein n=1 Tax=Paenibacillus elgii TaxID=189691 RepID=UPI000248CCE9|nr:hypothetical protein [Paenibacillus elgii]